MRRRSGPRVVWLPQTNANSFTPPLTSTFQRFRVFPPGGGGSFDVGEIPLVIDDTKDPLALESSLSDVENSGYRLRRVVGKIWVAALQQAEDLPTSMVITAGIMVRRADTTTGQSTADITGLAGLISPGEIENSGDPWVWRRSWILSNRSSTAPAGVDPWINAGPNNIFQYAGGNADAAHVDQKTARIVGPEERLFLDVAAYTIDGGDPQLIGIVEIITDLRVLGSMRVSSGNRRNSSR